MFNFFKFYSRSRRNRSRFIEFLYRNKFWKLNDFISFGRDVDSLDRDIEFLNSSSLKHQQISSRYLMLLFDIFSNRDLCRQISKFL